MVIIRSSRWVVKPMMLKKTLPPRPGARTYRLFNRTGSLTGQQYPSVPPELTPSCKEASAARVCHLEPIQLLGKATFTYILQGPWFTQIPSGSRLRSRASILTSHRYIGGTISEGSSSKGSGGFSSRDKSSRARLVA